MDNNPEAATMMEEESTFSFKNFLLSCLANWKWFILTVIFFVGVGMLYVMRQQPLYTRTLSLLIQDNNNSGGGLDVSTAFQSLGLGGPSTNVYNELISLQSPAVMYEVVKRLDLNVNMARRELPHSVTLYGKTMPFKLSYPQLDDVASVSLQLVLHPDNTFEIEKVNRVLIDGSIEKFNNIDIKGKVGGTPVNTPGGQFIMSPNVEYTGQRDDDITIKASVSSEKSAVERYCGMLKVDLADADAEVINLTINDYNVQRASDILNTVVDVYNEFWMRDKNRMAVATSEFITERLSMLVKELGDVDNDIADYQSKNMMPDIELTSKMYMDKSSGLEKEIQELRNTYTLVKYARDYVVNPANVNKIVPLMTNIGSTSLDQSISEYNTFLMQRDYLAENSSPDNPLVLDYNRKLKGMRETLVRSMNQNLGALDAQLKNLEQTEGLNKNNISAAPEQIKYLGSIKRDQAIKEQLYLFLLQKREETDLSKAFNAYNTRVITPPWGPSAPIAPRKGVTVMICFMLGLLVPAAVLYFVMVCDTKVHSRHDLENLPLPLTGEIPQIGRKSRFSHLFKNKKQRQKEIDTPKPIVMEGKRDVPNEAFRVVRSNIEIMLGKQLEHSALMVTSFNPGSGKSFVVYNLGASFALKKKRVLLIDGDLRHGSLSSYVGNPHHGLNSFLGGRENDPSKIIYESEEVKGLSVIPIGKRPPNPAELLEGGRFGELLDIVKKDYDIVIVDCPPVNVVVDTQLINRFADATLFVVRAGLLQKSAVKDLIALYNEKKLKRMSLLLNGTEAAHSSYYTYGNYESLND